jgi:hypothetical protein
MEYDLFGEVLKPSIAAKVAGVTTKGGTDKGDGVAVAGASKPDWLVSVRGISFIVKDGLKTTVWNG